MLCTRFSPPVSRSSRACSTFVSACNWFDVPKREPGEKFDFTKSVASKIRLKDRLSAEKIWLNISKRAQEHTPTRLARVRNPDPVEFYIDFISKGIPAVVEGLLHTSLAWNKWNEEYLRIAMKGREVTACVTPSGVVDEIHGPLLVRPLRTRIPYQTFSDIVFGKSHDSKGTYYVQDQASNLSGEFAPIATDISASLELGKFLSPSPIRNIWIGQSGSRSSLHFDFYENFHCLVAGTKKWTLFHPTDLPFLYLNYWSQGEWVYVTPADDSSLTQAEWRIAKYSRSNRDRDKFPWLEVNPDDVDESSHPRATNCNPIYYLQQPGETLFVPATWHHQVATGPDPTLAVNYWHEPHNPNVTTNFFVMTQLDRFVREKEHE